VKGGDRLPFRGFVENRDLATDLLKSRHRENQSGNQEPGRTPAKPKSELGTQGKVHIRGFRDIVTLVSLENRFF